MIIHEDGYIQHLNLRGMHDDDIDVLYLPRRLVSLDLSHGSLTRMDLSEFPRGLKRLYLKDNNIHKMAVTFHPPNLCKLDLRRNPLEKDGVKLTFPVPWQFTLHVPDNDSVHLSGGQKESYLE